MMDNYTLGIVWSIGTYTDNRFVFRHRNKYFIEQIQRHCGNTIYEQMGRTGKPQYVLKTTSIVPEDLEGWTERNSNQRNVPLLTDYKDFLRAYFEIHSCLDYCTSYYGRGKNKGLKYKRLRLRVYGNYVLMQSINDILKQHLKIGSKKVQWVNVNDKTAYLQYAAYDEIVTICNWIMGAPFCKEFWDDIDSKLKIPTKNYE